MTHELHSKRPGPYRSRNGMVLGVCRGLAEYLDFSVTWMRIIALLFLFFSAGWAILGYFGLALWMKLEPVLPIESAADQEFYNSFTTSRSMALHRLKRTFDGLDRRIQRIEDAVTAREYDWERRLNS
jgi:phage shock protein C